LFPQVRAGTARLHRGCRSRPHLVSGRRSQRIVSKRPENMIGTPRDTAQVARAWNRRPLLATLVTCASASARSWRPRCAPSAGVVPGGAEPPVSERFDSPERSRVEDRQSPDAARKSVRRTGPPAVSVGVPGVAGRGVDLAGQGAVCGRRSDHAAVPPSGW
jgi:hypothetical protein